MRRKRKITPIDQLPSGPVPQSVAIEKAKQRPIANVSNDIPPVSDELRATMPATPFADFGTSMRQASDALRQIGAAMGRALHSYDVRNPEISPRRETDAFRQLIANVCEGASTQYSTLAHSYVREMLHGWANQVTVFAHVPVTEVQDYFANYVPLDTWIGAARTGELDYSFGPFSSGDTVVGHLRFSLQPG